MEKSNFDQLLERYLNNQVTHEERAKIEMWLDIRKDKDNTSLELSQKQEEKLFKKIIDKRNKAADAAYFPGVKPPQSSWLLQLAATLLIITMVGVGAYYWTSSSNEQLATNDLQQIEKRILRDGTIVWLKPNSKLNFIEKSDIRYAELQGEALFEVSKDPEHPFIIHCDNIDIRVVGTSFNLKSTSDSLELNVLTGKVTVTLPNQQSIEVTPNEKIQYRRGGELLKQTLVPKEVETITANTEYNMTFTNEPLENVIKKLQKKFNKIIELKNSNLNQCRITADLTDHALDSSLERIEEVLDIKVEHTSSKIIITGNGCQ